MTQFIGTQMSIKVRHVLSTCGLDGHLCAYELSHLKPMTCNVDNI